MYTAEQSMTEEGIQVIDIYSDSKGFVCPFYEKSGTTSGYRSMVNCPFLLFNQSSALCWSLLVLHCFLTLS